jgi:branched-subunit amino acid aminotransferase/4-amino-4-deoxychorismate lyase
MAYGNAEAAGAIYVIARALGFDGVADAAIDAQREEIDESFGRCLDETKLGTYRVAELIADAVADSTPSLEHAVKALGYAVQQHLQDQAERATQIAALANMRDQLRDGGAA